VHKNTKKMMFFAQNVKHFGAPKHIADIRQGFGGFLGGRTYDHTDNVRIIP